MKKLFGFLMILCFMICSAPLAGNAYYCSALEENESNAEVSDLHSLEIKAKSCVLMDKKSGRVLLSLNENDKLPMASMTKMMVLDLVMDEIYAGRLNLNGDVVISDFAASLEGSECFLDAGQSYKVYELIKSVVVASANDSTVALAEAVSGTEKLFVNKMNKRAEELGMKNTHFVNSTGLDEKGHVSTALDMAIMMKKVSNHELLKELGKVWMYDMNHSGGRITSLTNTNRLIKSNPDVCFAKTGHTDEAGYCITAYAERDGKELIACVMGEESSPLRFADSTKLLSYGFSNFDNECVVDENKSIGKIKVKGGKIKEVDVYPADRFDVLTKAGESEKPTIEVVLESEVESPISAGENVGELIIAMNGEKHSIPLEIREEIEELTVLDIMKKLLK